ncbi:hypothetical protein HMPREF0044_1040 [Gleimia coleocanis DSM 15436]|uniref:Spermidine synthase n=2 Tax=Gleimia TaxID=2692113 RepID=C0W0G2_9ACTO|nr:hypothetical protein HMPREF0044_1040 [Gleimia coleocanis DSM 15436]
MARKNREKNTDTTPTLADGFTTVVGDVEFRLRVDNQRVTVFLDGLESSALNLVDASELEFEYMQYMTCVLNAFYPVPAPISALHLGACACALPRAWHALRPGSTQTAVDLNAPMLDLVRSLFDLPKSPALRLRHQDACESLAGVKPGKFNVIVRDVFAQGVTPAPLRSPGFYEQAANALEAGGILLVNCGHGDGVDAREEVRYALEKFPQVRVIAEGKTLAGGRRGNVVLAARFPFASEDATQTAAYWDEVSRGLRRLAFPARFLDEADTKRWAK